MINFPNGWKLSLLKDLLKIIHIVLFLKCLCKLTKIISYIIKIIDTFMLVEVMSICMLQ